MHLRKATDFIKKHELLVFMGLMALLYLFFYRDYFLTNRVLYGGDAYSLHYPAIFYLREKLLAGQFPFWSERIYAGFPVYANGEYAFLNPLRITLALLFDFTRVLKTEHAIFYTLGIFGMYKFLKSYKFALLPILISTTIYFFGFFNVLRQVHPNIVYATFLIPLNLWLIQHYMSNKKLRFVVINALLTALLIYYGNFNGVALALIPQALYLISFLTEKSQIKEVVRYSMVFLVALFILILPAVLPTAELYSQSARQSESVVYTDGSLSPIMSIFTAYPFPLGVDDSFIGKDFNNNYFYHEVHIYLGISALVLAFFGALTVKEQKLRVFLFSLLFMGVFLVFLRSNPVSSFQLFPLSLFRFWVRGSVLVSFAAALFAGYFVQNVRDFKIRRANVFLLIAAFAYMVLLFVLRGIGYEENAIVHYFKTGGFDRGYTLKIWLILGFLTFVTALAAIFVKSKKASNVFSALLLCIVVIDLFYYGSIAIKPLYGELENLISPAVYEASLDFEIKRVLYDDDVVVGNRPLFYKSWGLFGYALSYESKGYKDLLASSGLSLRRGTDFETGAESFTEKQLALFDQLGVEAIIHEDGSVEELASQGLPLFSGSEGEMLEVREGYIKAKIAQNNKSSIETSVRNYPGWNLTIDDTTAAFTSTKNDLFLEFELEEGEHVVEMEYKPTTLYKALAISSLLGLSAILIWKKPKNTS